MDAAITIWINQHWAHPWLDSFFFWVSDKATFSFPLLGLMIAGMISKFRANGFFLCIALLVLIGIADATGSVLKALINQPRPCAEIADSLRQVSPMVTMPCIDADDGMPSNHAVNFFAMWSFLALLFRRWQFWLPVLLISLCVSISRVYLGVHYPSQVLAGGALGCVFGFAAAYLAQKYFAFWRAVQTHAGARASPIQERK